MNKNDENKTLIFFKYIKAEKSNQQKSWNNNAIHDDEWTLVSLCKQVEENKTTSWTKNHFSCFVGFSNQFYK